MNYKISVIVPAYNEEKYLSRALDSLLQQSFTDYEVIIVNDGSIDGTQEIMDQYSEEHSHIRGVYQDNQGVAAARNRGIMEARGEYLAFLDGDDEFYPHALERLHDTAQKFGADLVLGRMKITNTFEAELYTGPIKLSNMIQVDPLDRELLWTGSMCNKLFRRSIIAKNSLTVPPLKYDEDSAFIILFALKCEKIVGCPHNIVKYQKRPFWEGYSVTQAVNEEYIKDHLTAYQIIEEALDEAFHDKDQEDYQRYQDEVGHRRIAILCNEFYRYFWKADPESLHLIKDSLEEVKGNISSLAWDKDVEKFHELRINQLICDKMVLAEEPLISIVLDFDKITGDDLSFLLGSIYSQEFPAFEVLAPLRLKDLADLDYENLKFIPALNKEKALEEANGSHIIFVEDKIFLEPRTLRYLYNHREGVDFVALKISQVKNNHVIHYPHQELAYSYRQRVEDSVRSQFNQLDLYYSNKLIRVDYLRNNLQFTGDTAQDVARLYREAKFRKLAGEYLFSHDPHLINRLPPSRAKQLHMSTYYLLKTKRFLQRAAAGSKKMLGSIFDPLYIHLLELLPIRDQVFFCSIRSDHQLIHNTLAVYQALDVPKVFITRKSPHPRAVQLRVWYHLLTSRVIVTDDYLSYLRLVKLRKDQKVIQIWHASGAYKKFGLDSATLSHEVETKTHQQYHAVVVSSEEVRRPYASAFGLPLEKIKALGIPGTDVFFQENTLEEDLYQAYPELRNKKIILYAPTFRENDWGERIPLDTGINWENLNNSLGEDEVFLIKRHPVMKEKLCKGIYDKIVDLTSAPLYSLMMASSVLITDYSSVIFEYSLLGKPIIFYCPDLYSYERDFYLDYPEDLPGVLVESSDELIQAIISVEQIQDDVLEEFKRKQMGACDGNSTKRVVALIKSYLS